MAGCSDLVQRDIPNYTQALGNSLEKGAAAAQGRSGSVSLQACQQATYYGGSGLGLTFPVALDNSDDTWNAYDNQSWPAAYLIDARGQIRHVSFGEGDYTGEEQLIRQLLTAARPGTALPPATDVPDITPDDPGQTPETYLGAEREQGYDGSTAYTAGQQSITAGTDAGITLAYHASHVYLDVGGTGTLTISADGTSKVIRVSGAPDIYTVANQQPARDGTVTIRLSPGLQAYSGHDVGLGELVHALAAKLAADAACVEPAERRAGRRTTIPRSTARTMSGWPGQPPRPRCRRG